VKRKILLAVTLLLLAGCQSFGRGVAEAVLEASGRSGEDTRRCEVVGPAFEGLEPYLRAQDALPPIGQAGPGRRQLKILFVHGIGTHLPGHGTALADNLSRALGLPVTAPRSKRIVIENPLRGGEVLGEINVTRMVDARRQRDAAFYELTWSTINRRAKEAIVFDQRSYFTSRRASINQAMRAFVNDVAPDPIAFAGVNRDTILRAVGQTLCWAASRSWDELPTETSGVLCGPNLPGFGSRVGADDLAFVTHSLGSRATLDALQELVNLPMLYEQPAGRRVLATFRDTVVPVFMLSNQLPLLEAGVEPQEIRGETARFCRPDSPERARRFFARTDLVAIGDPNDVMSYPVPNDWVDSDVESRLCPRPINALVEIAAVNNLFGLGEVANPLTAHTTYDLDERVAALIAKGAGHPGAAPIVRERCSFRELDESLAR